MIDDGMSSPQIAKQLRNVVSERTIRQWTSLYKRAGKIDSQKSTGRLRIVRTRNLIQKLKSDLLTRVEKVAEN